MQTPSGARLGIYRMGCPPDVCREYRWSASATMRRDRWPYTTEPGLQIKLGNLKPRPPRAILRGAGSFNLHKHSPAAAGGGAGDEGINVVREQVFFVTFHSSTGKLFFVACAREQGKLRTGKRGQNVVRPFLFYCQHVQIQFIFQAFPHEFFLYP